MESWHEDHAPLRGHLAALFGLLAAAIAFPMGTASARDVTVGPVAKTEINPFFVKTRQAG